MDLNFKRAMNLARVSEGGFVNNPKDPGGATNKGVTLANFRRYIKPKGTIEDLKKLTDEQVETVFYREYWSPICGPSLPSGIDYATFDFAINSGPARAAKYLQGVLGVPTDGKIGPRTLQAAEDSDAAATINQLCDDRLSFMKRAKHPKTKKLLWPTFGDGWSKRVSRVRKDSLAMIGRPADVKVINTETKVPVPVPKPTVPKSIETGVRRKSNLFSWITTAGGVAASGISAAMAADWQTILVIAASFLAAIIVIALFGQWLARSIVKIRKAVESETPAELPPELKVPHATTHIYME